MGPADRAGAEPRPGEGQACEEGVGADLSRHGFLVGYRLLGEYGDQLPQAAHAQDRDARHE